MATLASNRKAAFDFEILKTFEAGVELRGFEVKSLRRGLASLEGAYAIVRGGEVYLVGMTIPPYQPGNTPAAYRPDRTRRLLLKKDEIAELAGWESKKGLTIIASSVYNKGRRIKLAIAAARRKKKYDKREKIRERETKRELGRTLKTNAA